jgi:hypothetical protein
MCYRLEKTLDNVLKTVANEILNLPSMLTAYPTPKRLNFIVTQNRVIGKVSKNTAPEA